MIRVRVPATSANLGPGFDVLGMAIDRYNTFSFSEGEGSTSEESLMHIAYNKVYEYLGMEPEPVQIEVEADIPAARGLGSSAACIVGGIMGANQVLGGRLDREEILKLATEIEGHPDNVAPAIFGGLVVSVMDEGKIYTGKVPIKNDYEFLALVPNFQLSTEKARAVLPKTVSHSDGVYNVGRASLLITALVTGEDDLVKQGLKDCLHQPYRGDLIPDFDDIIKNICHMKALGCYLSGAGPTIMCIVRKDQVQIKERIVEFMKENYPDWQVTGHSLENKGALVI